MWSRARGPGLIGNPLFCGCGRVNSVLGWGRIRGPSRVGLLVVMKLLWCANPYSVGQDLVLRLWDVRLGVSADLGDSC